MHVGRMRAGVEYDNARIVSILVIVAFWHRFNILLSLVLRGEWETFPRVFAKCRRCRKAKYCGKECRSRAWSEGHRFWCNAREEEAGEGSTNAPVTTAASATTLAQNQTGDENGEGGGNPNGARQDGVERRQAQERELVRVTAVAAAAAATDSRIPNTNSPTVRPTSIFHRKMSN
jgi:hypothetical protein